MHFYTIESKDPLAVKEFLLSQEGDISFFDLRMIICQLQIDSAIDRVERAEGHYLSNGFGIELLLELSGYPQISKAINLLQITKSTQSIGIVSREEFNYGETGTISNGLSIKPANNLHELYNLTSRKLCDKVIARAASMRS